MIKNFLMLSATVASCYAMDESTDPAIVNATNADNLPVVELKEEIIESGAGAYPESKPVVEAVKVKRSVLWCGCGSADAVVTSNAPEELPVDKTTSGDQGLQQSEIALNEVEDELETGKSKESALTVTVESGNGKVAASGSGNFWNLIRNWRSQGNGSKDTQVLSPVDTTNVVDQQPVAAVVDVADVSQEEGK